MLPVDRAPIRDGTVVVEGERIAWVGRRVDLPAEYVGDRPREFPDCLLLPGFVNAHCHLFLSSTLGRLCGSADRFVDWLRAVIAEQVGWTPDVPRRAARAGLDLLASHGTTTVGDLGRAPDPETVLESGLRGVLFLEVVSFPAARAVETERAVVEWLDGFGARNGRAGRLRAGLAPHAPYSVSASLARRFGELARERRLPVAVHLAETREEIRFLAHGGGDFELLLRERGAWDEGWRPPGVSPVRWAADLGLLALPGAAVHLNYLTDDDIELLKQGRLVPVWCPGSHRWFGHHDHPAARLLAAEIPVALGTDSLASNTTLDMLAELRLAGAAFPEVPTESWLGGATLFAARALGLDGEVGSLTPGKQADVIALECSASAGEDPLAALLTEPVALRVRMIAGAEQRGRG